MAQLERQQKDGKERQAKLIAQLEQQQKEAKEQHAELMKLLKHRLMSEEKPEDK